MGPVIVGIKPARFQVDVLSGHMLSLGNQNIVISTRNNFFIFILELNYNVLVILDGKMSI